MKQNNYNAKTFGAWVFTMVAIIVWFSNMPKSHMIATIIAIIAAILFIYRGLCIVFAKPSDISTPKPHDEYGNIMVILGDPNGYEVSAQEAFGYTYSITQPELWFGWNDTEYISNKLSSHNMYVRVPKKYIK